MKYLTAVFVCINFVLFTVLTVAPCHCQGLPIKPSRTISFTTDEGSYMNVDISPDGKTILFDLLGDLFTLPAKGGRATQITRGLAINARPIWSPDGKMIAYISDRSGDNHLHVRNVSGKSDLPIGSAFPQFTLQHNFLWAPDGHAFAMDDSVYALTGETFPPLIRRPVQFSGDGLTGYGLDSGMLYRYNLSKKTRAAATPRLAGFDGYNSCVSPDGRWWCYFKNDSNKRRLIAYDLTAEKGQILVDNLAHHVSEGVEGDFHYSFSSDSKSLYIGYCGKIHRIAMSNGKDEIIPFVVTVHADLGPLNYNTYRITHDQLKVRYTRSASSSPDGKHLVFSALDRVYIMDLPAGKPRVLAPQPISQFQPAYSPDGKWIAYVSWCDTVGGYLWRVPSAGGTPERLTDSAGEYQRPSWSPDGTYLAVIKGGPTYTFPSDSDFAKLYAVGKGPARLGFIGDRGIGQLQLVDIREHTYTVIADSIPLWNNVDFSNDGKRIFYSSFTWSPTPRPQFFSRDLSGKDLQTIAAGVDQAGSAQRAIAPDGRFIVYSQDEGLYLVPVQALSQSTLLYDPSASSAIRFAAGVDPHWENGGKTLSWTYGNQFYQIDPDKIVAQAEKDYRQRGAQLIKRPGFIEIAITPDRVIPIQLAVPRSYGHGTLVLENARIITMQGEKVITRGSIVIKDGRFVAVGEVGKVKIPAGATKIDLEGTTIMPGLIDLHDHMSLPSDISPQQSWVYLANLAYGITTARDPSSNFDSYGYSELLESGQMIGPRLFTVGVAVGHEEIPASDRDDLLAIVHNRAVLGGICIKNYMLPAPRANRQWLNLYARQAHINLTNEGWIEPQLRIGMIKDGAAGVEHNAYWDDAYSDIMLFYAKSGIYFTPTLQVTPSIETKAYLNYKYWRNADAKLLRYSYSDPAGKPTSNGAESREVITQWKPADTTGASFTFDTRLDARIRHLGGHVTLGSHGNDKGIGAHNELWALQMGGLTNLEALQAATILGAEAIGIQQDVGSIETGKLADLIILNKNPLDDIHNSREIRYVMKNGILYDGDTLDEVWPEHKKCSKY